MLGEQSGVHSAVAPTGVWLLEGLLDTVLVSEAEEEAEVDTDPDSEAVEDGVSVHGTRSAELDPLGLGLGLGNGGLDLVAEAVDDNEVEQVVHGDRVADDVLDTLEVALSEVDDVTEADRDLHGVTG